ncbi:extracellular calcium-sensing receptor-like [Acipenser ruthenus]|uniref:extracellular calcium-sensing receptor n=1 Tax=Acipenser ruthenus TaxID=7906 RepID=UPI00274272B4|nr:extracellular calcium-sensing receptor [Acipenser ruthenus]XP_058875331.1 extracellular calcium-sensing receptor-like [Acipenser ruthenus]
MVTHYQAGHVVLGALFPIHSKGIKEEQTFQAQPGKLQCEGINFRAFRWSQAMIFIIEEINRNKTLLPNVTLGYKFYDTCGIAFQSVRSTLALINGPEDNDAKKCNGAPSVPVIIGDSGSSLSIAVLRVLKLFSVPLVSYFASCACLGNHHEFPTFFRTVPSDLNQASALANLVQRFGWTWVGTIAVDDDYGRSGIQMFHDEVTKLGICIAYTVIIPKLVSKEKVVQIVEIIKKSTAKVIVAFAIEDDIKPLIEEIVLQNITDRQWIASEAWITSALISKKEHLISLGGTIGFAIRKAEIPEFKDFLLKLNPLEKPYNLFAREFWETLFQCSFKTADPVSNHSVASHALYNKTCTGKENLKESASIYSDVTQLRVTYNLHKAIYAVAHALHNLQACENSKGPFFNKTCADIYNVQPWQVVHYLNEVKFTNQFGEEVYFDENGDSVGSYDIINWQRNPDGSTKYMTVGRFDAAAPLEQQIVLDEDKIIWNGGQSEVPKSVCTDSCPSGYRKAARVGQPVCCYDCVPCADGTISITTDAVECIPCLLEYWSNKERNSCIPKEIEYLSFADIVGIISVTISILGAVLTTAVAAIFLKNKNTPIVRANNSELSFLLLISLVFCFLCAITFVGQPTAWACKLRRTSFSISFVLCLSCVLSKTVVVLMAFKATLPGNNVMKWFGPTQQRFSVFLCTGVQVVICIVWLTVSPPFAFKNTRHYNNRIILECDLGSVTLFCCVLGYIGFLACVCFALAFLARKLPDNFNEAKFITFSMLIFCAVWITFIPAYISSPGKYTVAVEIFAILSSSFGLLLCIFTPKCYIILFKPENNSRKYLMSRAN